jgi:hypothetical protein
MASRIGSELLASSILEALDAPWRWVRHNGASEDRGVRAQARDNIEDAGRSELRVQNDYTGRYPIELLQNAHDACADARKEGAAWFAITSTALLVANEGEPFTARRIRSLVRLGSSEKLPGRERRQTIGYKGVGFTSVFEISDTPQIIGETARFGFDRRRARREVSRILGADLDAVAARGFPFALDDDDWSVDRQAVQRLFRAGATTVVRLPVRRKRDVTKVAEALEASTPREALLFMPWINELSVSVDGAERHWTRRRGKPVGAGRVTHLRETRGATESWLVARDALPMPRNVSTELSDPLWKGVRELNVAVAIPWSRGPNPGAEPQHLHVYFPTDDLLGRALLVHGDFYVDSSRRRIETAGAGGAVSYAVAKSAARLGTQLASSVAQHGRPLLECLAQRDTPSGFGVQMGELLDDALKGSAILRTADPAALRKPPTTRRLGFQATRFERSLLAALHPRYDILRPGDDHSELATGLLECLGCEELTHEAIAGRVDFRRLTTPYSDALRVLGTWLGDIGERELPAVVEVLRGRTVVRDVQDRWRRPRDVFIVRPESPALPSRLRKTELPPSDDPLVRRVFRTLEIQELTPTAAIETVIAALNDEGFGATPAAAAQVHAFFRDAWQRSKRELTAYRGELGRVQVPVRTARGRRESWAPAESAYLPSAWTGNNLLETLYGPFDACEFLAVVKPSDEGAAESLAGFYSLLGVASEPRQLKYAGSHYERSTWQTLSHFSEWLRLERVEAAFTCPDGHRGTGRRVALASVDRLDKLLEREDPRTNAALLAYLGATPNPFGGDAEVYCEASSHRQTKVRNRAIGYQRWLLETHSWIPVRNDPSGAKSRSPGEAWIGTRMPNWLMVPQARIKAEHARGLGLTSSDRPGPEAVEHALLALHAVFPDLADATTDVRRSAGWLATRLNRSLQHGGVDARSSTPPLPAVLAGHDAWSTSPVIADLPALDPISIPGVEFLASGSWRGFRRAYGIKRASEVVAHQLDLGDQVKMRPILSSRRTAELAALLATNGANEDRVATRLARLAERPVQSVSVRYFLDDTPLAAATRDFCLDVRRDRTGRVIGATLFVTPNLGPDARIALGSELAEYLDEPTRHSEVSLFLTNPDSLVADQQLSQEDLDEAMKRVDSRRRAVTLEGSTDDLDIEDLIHDVGTAGIETTLDDSDDEIVDAVPARDQHDQTSGHHDQPRRDVLPVELPPLDHAHVIGHDVAAAAPADKSQPRARDATRRDTRSAARGSVDWARMESDRRAYGRRGEEAAYENERRRLVAAGFPPDTVDWVSKKDETSPYDVKSIDDDGGPRYIEVKSTTGSDPTEAFPISTAELRFALRNRERYFIYRVTNVKDSTPEVHRYRDPMRDLETESAQLRMTNALMSLPAQRENE